MGWGAFGVAIAALLVAIFGLIQSDDSEAAAPEGGGGVPTVIDVELSEFAISPSTLVAPPGPIQLRISNVGTAVHNVSFPDLGKITADMQPGDVETLDLGTVAVGEWSMLCEIAGHAGAGMTGTLSVSEGASAGEDDEEGALHDGYDNWQEMDYAMEARGKAFPAETIGGPGNQPMEPEIEADGTKVFRLVAEEVEWEVEPGKIVTAKAYNGMIPGPEIRVDVGDKVKIELVNNLNESTNIHFHGIRVPNNMDGVDPYTEDPTRPGETHVYEFELLEPAVGIYHPHHDAQIQIPDGLFGAFMVGEMPIQDVLKADGYDNVTKEIQMVLNDSGATGLSLNGKSFPATQPYTMRLGEVMMVHYQNEGLQGHPMHLHQPMGWIIAKDGEPLIDPMPADTIWVGPGERYTVLYKAVDQGVWAWHCHILSHAEGPDGIFGMATALVVTP